MFYVYIIKSKSFDQYYTGHTSDLQNRLKDHNSGKSQHTSKYKPWVLVIYIAFETEELALAFEKYLKTGSGIAFARKHFL